MQPLLRNVEKSSYEQLPSNFQHFFTLREYSGNVNNENTEFVIHRYGDRYRYLQPT